MSRDAYPVFGGWWRWRRTPARLFLGAVAAALCAVAVRAQAPVYLPQVEQWGMQEVSVRSSKTYANPFTDVKFEARFRSGSREVVAAGFFDGHGVWKVRLMPEVQGDWTFTTASGDPELNQKTGSFKVGPPRAGNHGPVRVSEKYHFRYADGTPYFLLGTTTYGGVGGDLRNRIRTVNQLSHAPFNKTRFQLLSSFVRSADGVGPFETLPGGKMDYRRPNPEFYARVEASLLDLQTLGVEADVIFLTPYDQRPDGLSSMGAEADELYLRYAVARLAAFRNVWWTMSNEFELHRVPKDWKKLGTMVSEIDPYNHLLGIHNCCMAFYDNSEPWITHSILQDITLQRLTPVMRNNAWLELDARKIGKPVVVDEYGYEGNNGMTWGSFSAREMVDMHWAITLAGAYASHGESYSGGGSATGEFTGDSPVRLGFLKKIMEDAPYREMEPAPDIASVDSPTFSVLSKRGAYHLIMFWPPRQTADWNLGFFGPATPSKPLPPKPRGEGALSSASPGDVEFKIGEGVFRVDLIDPWAMKVTTLGYTNGPAQRIRARITPGIIRLVKVDRAEPGAPVGNVSQLGAPARGPLAP
jgi:hypothetical protein